MQNYFDDIAKIVSNNINQKEKYTLWFSAEQLDFVRFNNAKVRQAGNVDQSYIELGLIEKNKHSSIKLGLTHNLDLDKKNIINALSLLRKQIMQALDDPYLLINEEVQNTFFKEESNPIDNEEIIFDILNQAKGFDLVGCFYSGPVFKGFTNSFGQKNWYEKSSFLIDTSIYHSSDKAVKQSYAATKYDGNIFSKKLEEAKKAINIFNQPTKKIPKGGYRVYFSPAAVYEILSLINWGGFSEKELRIKNSPLNLILSGKKQLNPKFSLSEHINLGIGPDFQEQGFVKPKKIDLLTHGKFASSLISPKTAKEYAINHNAANEEETATSLELCPGDIQSDTILKTLDDGLFINNLWYLNFSDRQNGKITGMTRFLCYEVKNGHPTNAFNVMRFDDSIFRMFGDNLLGLTKERELIIDNDTYEERSTNCAILPGIIAEDVRFTL